MLIIRRRVGERIVVGSNIEVTVASATRRVVRLAIQAPKGIPVLRGEVHDAVVAANVAATQAIVEIHTAGETPADGEDLGEELVVEVHEEEISDTASTGDEQEERQEKQDDSD